MKKILIFLIVLGAITFINIDLFASSYDDPVSTQTIDLNTPITILNNHTLKDLFYTNIQSNNAYGLDGLNGWGSFASVNSILTTQNILVNNVADGTNWEPLVSNQAQMTAGHNYFVSLRVMVDSASAYTIRYRDNNTDYGLISQPELSPNVWYNLTFSYTSVSGGDFMLRHYHNTNPLGNSMYLDLNYGLIIVDKTYYGLTNVSDAMIEYFLHLFHILNLGISPEVYYNQGYDIGEDFGYNDGYNDGLIEGEYNGYIDGYDVGYNEGMDYAATNNITLLSVFQLIIGVVMSMLGFIINIELFGISIASVLGTLAIGIGIIWTLKLIRG